MSTGKWADLVAPLPTPKTTPLHPVAGTRREGLVYERVYEWRSYPDEAPIITRREDPRDPESPETREPAAWWSPRSVGFRAKLLVNPLVGEVRRAIRAHIAVLTMTGDESDHFKALADRVIAWDYVQIDAEGNRVPVPTPAEGGWEQFYELPNDCLIWLVEELENAHLPKATTTRPTKPVGPTDSPTPSETDPEPEPPAS